MAAQNYNVIGVMSGTSLDGVDLAHIFFAVDNGKWTFTIGACETIPYPEVWVQKLRSAVDFSDAELRQLDIDYTQLLGTFIAGFIAQNGITELDAVCSHGHTILHQPQKRLTLQIGNLPQIAEIIGQKTVCDFRVQDVVMGGQGAPLVPIGDRILFSDYRYCLNLGGFSNISYEADGSRTAFDISAVNTVLNHYANRFGLEYDAAGSIAASGRLDEGLLAELNALDYYQASPPKSLGFEYVKQTLLPLLEKYAIADADKMRTFTQHVANQIAKALPDHNGKMLITGGGAYNEFLIERLRAKCPTLTIEIPDARLLEFKEALIFALLGVLRLRGENNVLASVTGAPHDHCAGFVYG